MGITKRRKRRKRRKGRKEGKKEIELKRNRAIGSKIMRNQGAGKKRLKL